MVVQKIHIRSMHLQYYGSSHPQGVNAYSAHEDCNGDLCLLVSMPSVHACMHK